MAEEYTCIECENLYDDRDGDTDERMCNRCLNEHIIINLDAPNLDGDPTTADKHNKEWMESNANV